MERKHLFVSYVIVGDGHFSIYGDICFIIDDGENSMTITQIRDFIKERAAKNNPNINSWNDPALLNIQLLDEGVAKMLYNENN